MPLVDIPVGPPHIYSPAVRNNHEDPESSRLTTEHDTASWRRHILGTPPPMTHVSSCPLIRPQRFGFSIMWICRHQPEDTRRRRIGASLLFRALPNGHANCYDRALCLLFTRGEILCANQSCHSTPPVQDKNGRRAP